MCLALLGWHFELTFYLKSDSNIVFFRPCLNGGTCVNGVGSYSCQCTPQFTGETCQDEVEGNIFNWVNVATVVANWDETAVKLKCRKNHWEYENKQYTIEKSIENANRNEKKNSNFSKFVCF